MKCWIYFSPESPLMRMLLGITHTSPPASTNNAQSYTHNRFTQPATPSSPTGDILPLPSEGTISRPALHAHLAPCSLSTSSLQLLHPCHHAAWLWEAQKLDSFYPRTEGLWWGWARGMKPWPALKRPIPSQLSQGDFQKTPGNHVRLRGIS